MPTFIAIAAVMFDALVAPRIPSVPKYFLAMPCVLTPLSRCVPAVIAAKTSKGEHVATHAYSSFPAGRTGHRRNARGLLAADRPHRRGLGPASGAGLAQRPADDDR